VYLIDSDILIFALRGVPEVVRNFEAHAADPKALSAISFGELLYGALKSDHPLENAAKVRRLAELFPVVDASQAVMETFGSLKADLERRGEKLDDFDLVVASTAMHLSYALVTNNVRHFQRIPDLTVENWAQ